MTMKEFAEMLSGCEDGGLELKTSLELNETLKNLLSKSDRAMEIYALARIKELEKQVKELTPQPAPSLPLAVHSEAEIVRGCISLMQELTGRFEDYLDFMDITPENEEERFQTEFTYFRIVQRLLLWRTSHRGGTSTMQKCGELGFDSGDTIIFEDERSE